MVDSFVVLFLLVLKLSVELSKSSELLRCLFGIFSGAKFVLVASNINNLVNFLFCNMKLIKKVFQIIYNIFNNKK